MADWVNILNSQSPHLTLNDIDQKYPFDIALATNTNLIYEYDPVNRLYGNDVINGGVYQKKKVYTYGSINEFDISLGTNYNDVLYIGATIGIPFIRYYENNQYLSLIHI